MAAIRTQATINKTVQPFIYEYFNVIAVHQNSYGNAKSRMARIFNAAVTELNKDNTRNVLPKYILVIMDSEIIKMAEFFDCGVKQIMKDCMYWINKNLISIIETRKEDIKGKRPGAMYPVNEPKIIWVSVIPRPHINSKKEIFSLVGKCNEIMMEMADKCLNSYYIKLETVSKLSYFDMCGRLTPAGKESFWKEIDYIVKKCDQDGLDLKPQRASESSSLNTKNNNYGRPVNNSSQVRASSGRDETHHSKNFHRTQNHRPAACCSHDNFNHHHWNNRCESFSESHHNRSHSHHDIRRY